MSATIFDVGYGPKPVGMPTNNFLTPLRVEYQNGARSVFGFTWGKPKWQILEPFTYRLENGVEYVTVSRGFVTDFASIPMVVRALWRSPGGPWDKPAVIHDCLYKERVVHHVDGGSRLIDRAEADAIFLEAMGVTGTPRGAKQSIYRGVRVGGWWAWRQHRKEEAR